LTNEILVAVDGSKQSIKIVDAACEIAKGLSTGILLVSVVHLRDEEPEGVKEYEKTEQYPDAYADYLKGISEKLSGNLSTYVKSKGISVRAYTPEGNPAAEILNIVELEEPKMIVLGVKGLHGIARFRSLGSVARNVIENSAVPVLCVPSKS